MARENKTHRHTVPNSNYSSFPCYLEEIKLKTNVINCDNNGNDEDNNRDNFEVNVSMHDKLRMCFAEMETVKNHFDSRRRKGQSRKKTSNQNVDQAATAPPFTNRQTPSRDADNSTQLPPSDNVAKTMDSENKFTAHLVRTNSKDSMDEGDTSVVEKELPKSVDIISQTSTYKKRDPAISSLNASDYPRVVHSRRAVSDPFGGLDKSQEKILPGKIDSTHNQFCFDNQTIFGDNSGLNSSCKPYRLQFNWSNSATETRKDDLEQIKKSSTRKSYDEWLEKLDEINDMSRSTINRIKKLERDISNLRMTTDHLSTKTPASKIPVTTSKSNARITQSYIKKFCDKCTNTDLDMEFMERLVSQLNTDLLTSTVPRGYKPKGSIDSATNTEPTKSVRRRLTAVIGRSVEIQTDFENKTTADRELTFADVCTQTSNNDKLDQDSQIIYDLNYPKSVQNTGLENSTEMSILDLPNIEHQTPFTTKTTTEHIKEPRFGSRNSQASQSILTPEPIIEMYSDSEDTNFDDFEKNIFSEISRRALIKNKIINRKSPEFENDFNSNNKDNLDQMRLRNSSTQTNNRNTSHFDMQTDNQNAKHEKNSSFNRNLQSTSKIVIERTRLNQRETSEILLKTNIDKQGKVYRTTEVKNSKYKPSGREEARSQSKVPNNPVPKPDLNGQTNKLRKVNSDVNVYHSNNEFSRPMSAFDLTQSDLTKKSDDDFISNKAFSSIDISAKSPVASEGYFSEHPDSQRMFTPLSEPVIEPPESFQNHFDPSWQELSKSSVTNQVVNEILEPFKDFEYGKNNLVTLTNETSIDNNGKQTNITTKSRTIRQYKPKDSVQTKSTLNLNTHSEQSGDSVNAELCRSQSMSQCNLQASYQHEPTNSQLIRYEQSSENQDKHYLPLNQQTSDGQNTCNFSLVYHYGNNIVFRADFGLSKLPCFETNL